MRPQRIQLSRRRGWRMPAGAVKVDRSTPWGNPFVGDGDGVNRADVARLFAEHLKRPEQAEKIEAIRRELHGKDLACWCPLDQPCHADVLLRIANPTDQDIAEDTADALNAAGLACHVRRWHQGEHGWFVVRDDNYSRVWPSPPSSPVGP